MTTTIIAPASSAGSGAALSWPLRALLASSLFGAGIIHVAMVPSHSGEWLAEGVAFAIVGVAQLLLAIAFIARPMRWMLVFAVAANLAFIGAWAWTRTVGPPFGPAAHIAHDVGAVDVVCVVLEAVVVLVAMVALARPRIGAGLAPSTLVGLSIVPVSILVLSTAVIASPSASEHEHVGDDDSHVESTETAADGHDHGHGSIAQAPVDDKGLALLSNGEMAHDYGPDQPLDATTRAVLVHQLALTRLIVDRFPTLADAKAAGSQPAGGFAPGLGLHMSTPLTGMPEAPPADASLPSMPGVLSDAEVLRPANLLYAGTSDDSPIAGLMYYSTSPQEPEGFAGPNDHWHTHGSLCIKMAGKIEVLHPAEQTNEACGAIGGIFVERTSYMVHVWTVPGYESNRGVFSDINPAVTCPDGTYYTVSEQEHERYKTNKCLSNPA
jgi:hypothetical protein